MKKLLFAGIILVACSPIVRSQEKPCIVVQSFSTGPNVSWPYDAKQMATQTAAELQAKVGKTFTVGVEAPSGCQGTYSLGGEIVEWHPGNRAKRVLVGMGSGRETAKIHFWLDAPSGKRVFDREDTIRAEFWGNAYAGSVGELVHPLASKVADRLNHSKLN
jgi:uncharacterized protein DUF4410